MSIKGKGENECDTMFIVLYGHRFTLECLSKIVGVLPMTIHNRRVSGMSEKEAVFKYITPQERADEQDILRQAEIPQPGIWGGTFPKGGIGGRRSSAEVQEIQYHGGRFHGGEW